MNHKLFPEEFQFQKNWRPYQARVLDELESHLGDNKLHVIAAPGSGKTVLGIEVLRRLDKPTLILAPTITIREQWVARLESLFLPQGYPISDWVTTDLKNPKHLTVTTYQALHTVITGMEEVLEETDDTLLFDDDVTPLISGRNEVISRLQHIMINTIIIDEAHHLRSEWWASLIKLIQTLASPTIVALTATPPYDVLPIEWERYQKLCGPIDAEISVPELVLERNLCPHQDYIYFSYPTKDEKEIIKRYRENVDLFYKKICSNGRFIGIIKRHPWIVSPSKHFDELYKKPKYLSSMIIFLNEVGVDIPDNILEVMGTQRKEIPKLNLEWLEVLLTGCLFSDDLLIERQLSTMEQIKEYLLNIRAIEHNKVTLRTTNQIKKILVTSKSKLRSINDIVKVENQNLGDELRMVILTDFIRKSEMPRTVGDTKSINKIGVVPIFENIRREFNTLESIGILCGSLVVIPTQIVDEVKSICIMNGIKDNQIKFNTLAHDNRFSSFEIIGENRKQIVRIITEVFNRGKITVLVGTKSLLGEGWDAPSINCLVMASFVGSYMLSNQIRGRAIRTQVNNPNKTANIWHLVCVEDTYAYPGDDYDTMERRFRAFVGVSFIEPIISNGIDRLDIGEPPFTKDRIEALNTTMVSYAISRELLAQRWADALSEGIKMVEEIRAPIFSLPRLFVFRNTITAIITEAILLAGVYLSGHIRMMNEMGNRYTLETLFYMLMIGLLIVAIIIIPALIKALWLFLKHGPVSSSIKQIGKTLLKTLIYCGEIKTNVRKMKVKTKKDDMGYVYCSLVGGSFYETYVFLDNLKELLGPIRNPRYVIIRKDIFGRLHRKDYHTVPKVIGAKKQYAHYFEKMWKRYVGNAKVLFTRTPDGRKVLLMAREQALSSVFLRRAEKMSRWE